MVDLYMSEKILASRALHNMQLAYQKNKSTAKALCCLLTVCPNKQKHHFFGKYSLMILLVILNSAGA